MSDQGQVVVQGVRLDACVDSGAESRTAGGAI